MDLLVANDVAEPGSGFGTDTNKVTIYSVDGAPEELPLMSKREVAELLLDRVVVRLVVAGGNPAVPVPAEPTEAAEPAALAERAEPAAPAEVAEPTAPTAPAEMTP